MTAQTSLLALLIAGALVDAGCSHGAASDVGDGGIKDQMECRDTPDCPEELVCELAKGKCVPPFGQDLRTPSTEPDLRTPPDLAPISCVFDRDCGNPDVRCCAGSCRAYLDRNSCGTCGNSCGVDPAVQCCPYGARAEEAACADLKKSTKSCGRCGVVCPDTPQALGMCCDGLCKDRLTDSKNCGQCGLVCPAGQRCVRGLCQR